MWSRLVFVTEPSIRHWQLAHSQKCTSASSRTQFKFFVQVSRLASRGCTGPNWDFGISRPRRAETLEKTRLEQSRAEIRVSTTASTAIVETHYTNEKNAGPASKEAQKCRFLKGRARMQHLEWLCSKSRYCFLSTVHYANRLILHDSQLGWSRFTSTHGGIWRGQYSLSKGNSNVLTNKNASFDAKVGSADEISGPHYSQLY